MTAPFLNTGASDVSQIFFQLPACVSSGVVISDIATVHDEAYDILQDEEWDYEWRACVVPINLIVSGPFDAS